MIAAVSALVLTGALGLARLQRSAPAPDDARVAAPPAPTRSPAPPAARTPPIDAPSRSARGDAPERAAPPPRAASPATVAPAVDPAAPPPLAGDTDPGADPLADSDFAARYLRVAELFRREPRDPTASVAMEREVLDRIAQQPGLALTSIDVECRTTTCRVQLIGPDVVDESRNIGFEEFGAAVGSTRIGADGSLITELLLARDAAAAQ
jgi:hypothetical protein